MPTDDLTPEQMLKLWTQFYTGEMMKLQDQLIKQSHEWQKNYGGVLN
jgi:hypothetical protein